MSYTPRAVSVESIEPLKGMFAPVTSIWLSLMIPAGAVEVAAKAVPAAIRLIPD
jgi:hypothetical protein